MTEWEIVKPNGHIDRDRYGRPLIHPVGGGRPVPYTRCTTFVGAIEDRYRLGLREQRMVALGIADRDDLRLAVQAHRDDRNKLDEFCEDAKQQSRAQVKATIGTAVHALCEQVDRGQELGPIPDEFAADIDAYRTATAGLQMVEIERFMVLDPWRIGGTPDRIVKVDGKLRIADIKTGGIDYGIGKIAAQLAVYARSSHYDPKTHERTISGVENDWGIVIHLPAGEGRCTLHRVNLLKGWRGVQLCKQVRDWRSQKFADFARGMGEAEAQPEPEDRAAAITLGIDDAETVEELHQLWLAFESEWTDEHTQAAAARKATLQGRVA